jgi:hypothetical protein
MYDNVLNENVPEEFLSFLEEADERTAATPSEGTEAIGAAPVSARAMKTEP